MTENRFRALGLPLGPSIRIRLFAGVPGLLGQLVKADGRVDVVAQDRFPGIHIPAKQGIDAFREQRVAKGRVAFDACFHGVLE